MVVSSTIKISFVSRSERLGPAQRERERERERERGGGGGGDKKRQTDICTGSCGQALTASSLLTAKLFKQFVGWLLNVPATGECISGTDLLRQFYVLPH